MITIVINLVIILVDGKAGIEVGTELAWDKAGEAGLPKAIFINKFDDNEARFAKILNEKRGSIEIKHECLENPHIWGADEIYEWLAE